MYSVRKMGLTLSQLIDLGKQLSRNDRRLLSVYRSETTDRRSMPRERFVIIFCYALPSFPHRVVRRESRPQVRR